MPKSLVLSAINAGIVKLEKIALAFDVSEIAAMDRLEMLGIISL